MNTDFILKIVEIIGGLGTFAAAIVAWRTLKEIQKQRIDAQKPQLLFKSFTTGSLDVKNIAHKVPVEWKGSNKALESQIIFEMINAGRDVARQISFEYILDIDSFIRLLIEKDIDKELRYDYKKGRLSIGSSTGIIHQNISTKVNMGITDSLEYLLTRSTVEKPSSFAIPKEYLILNSCLLYLSKRYGFSIFTDDIPRLYIKTSYVDISGNKTEDIYQEMDTFHFKEGEFHFTLKKVCFIDFKNII